MGTVLVICIVIILSLSIISIGIAVTQEHSEYKKREATAKPLVARIQKAYEEMKQDENCQKIFNNCKAKIENDSSKLECVYISSGGGSVVFVYKYEKVDFPQESSWKYNSKLTNCNFCNNQNHISTDGVLSGLGETALMYWLITEIPFMTYRYHSKNDGNTVVMNSDLVQETRDLYTACVRNSFVWEDDDTVSAESAASAVPIASVRAIFPSKSR